MAYNNPLYIYIWLISIIPYINRITRVLVTAQVVAQSVTTLPIRFEHSCWTLLAPPKEKSTAQLAAQHVNG